MFETASWITKHAADLNIGPDQIRAASVRLHLGTEILKQSPNGHRLSYTLDSSKRFIFRPTNVYLVSLDTHLTLPDTHAAVLVLLPELSRQGLIMNSGVMLPHGEALGKVALHTTVPIELRAGQPLVDVYFQPLSEPLRAQPEALVL